MKDLFESNCEIALVFDQEGRKPEKHELNTLKSTLMIQVNCCIQRCQALLDCI